MRPIVFFVVVIAACLSCNKEEVTDAEPVEVYLLKTIRFVPGKCQIDPSLSAIEDTPVIKNQDIIKYSPTFKEFKLSDAAFQKVKTFMDRTPFAITVDKQVIYYGLFKPSISSSSCDHSITMDVSWSSASKIVLRLGYPGQLPGVTIDDQRNNPILLASLEKQGKLQP